MFSYRLLRRRFRHYVLAHPDWRVRTGLGLVYALLVATAWTVGQVSNLIIHAAASMFRATFTGGVVAVMAKVAAFFLILGLLAAAVGADSLAHGLIVLSAAPIMILGLAYMTRGALR